MKKKKQEIIYRSNECLIANACNKILSYFKNK